MKYPALMTYIHDRNTVSDWCSRLHDDERLAEVGEFADVAAQMEQARADYKAQQEARGKNGYPYNAAMGEFLGLPIKPTNHEPEHGYYMASGVMNHYRLGVARREVLALVAEGRELKIVTGRAKDTRKPVRFARFCGEQIRVEGAAVTAANSKRRVRLSSSWSVETCLEAVARALRTGNAYGEDCNA